MTLCPCAVNELADCQQWLVNFDDLERYVQLSNPIANLDGTSSFSKVLDHLSICDFILGAHFLRMEYGRPRAEPRRHYSVGRPTVHCEGELLPCDLL